MRLNFSSPSHFTSTPCLPPSEVDEFVDSFINMDHCICIGDNDIQSTEKQQSSGSSSSSIEYFEQDGIETFSVVDDLYGDVLIMMEEEDDHMGYEWLSG